LSWISTPNFFSLSISDGLDTLCSVVNDITSYKASPKFEGTYKWYETTKYNKNKNIIQKENEQTENKKHTLTTGCRFGFPGSISFDAAGEAIETAPLETWWLICNKTRWPKKITKKKKKSKNIYYHHYLKKAKESPTFAACT
jgi:hypothetical protein